MRPISHTLHLQNLVTIASSEAETGCQHPRRVDTAGYCQKRALSPPAVAQRPLSGASPGRSCAMLKLLAKLLGEGMVFFESGKAAKDIRITHEAANWGQWLELSKLFKHVDGETAWMVTVAYGSGALYAIAIILIIISMYLIINVRRWRRARIFVSYQHQFEGIATGIAAKLKAKQLNPIKLPFLDDPEHNSLLDAVKEGVSRSDIVVCIPGEKSSFVENEVSMAFALEKPLIFVATNEYLGRIPNSAKRGYPIINLNSLDEGGWDSFCSFCLYVSGYNMSLIHMCLCILGRYLRILGVFVFVYIAMFAAVVLWADRATVGRNFGLIENAIIISMVLLFVVPYLAFTIGRMTVAENLRRIIGRQSFDLDIAPATLTYNLRKADVADILFKGDLVADHENKKAAAFAADKSVALPLETSNEDVKAAISGAMSGALAGDASSQARWGQFLYSGQGCPVDKAEAAIWFRKAADQGIAEAQYSLGLLYERGDGVEQNNTRAAHWYLLAATQGHALAQNALAELYHEGRGVAQDYAAALRWYESAADQGVASAAYNAGYLYFQGLHVKRDRDKARSLFEAAASSSFALAKYALGLIHENGLGVKKDRGKAKSFYEAAAADGDIDAQKAVARLSRRWIWQFWARAPATAAA
jgi:TPR repeat protein